MRNSKTVVILDYRNVITKASGEVISRHEKYAQLLMQNSDIKLQIHSPGKRVATNSRHINFSFSGHSPLKAFSYLRTLNHELKINNLTPVLLISGDPWESLIMTRLFRYFSKRSIPIQVQFHGDIASDRWKHLNLRNFLRFHFTFLALGRKKDMFFRSVSRIQSRNIELRFGIESKSIDILPVELNLPNSTQQLKVKSPRLRLGFVGRIHQDRGTGLFIEIIRILEKLHEGIEAVVVGDGPARDDFLGSLSAFGPNVNVNYLGFLEGESFAKAWKDIDILLSTAPLESYGRTIRECLISTTPVLAIESSGVLELDYALKLNWIQLISLPLEPTKLNHQVKTALGIEISPQYREALTKESQRSSLNLILRWIEIIQESQRQLELDN